MIVSQRCLSPAAVIHSLLYHVAESMFGSCGKVAHPPPRFLVAATVTDRPFNVLNSRRFLNRIVSDTFLVGDMLSSLFVRRSWHAMETPH